MQIVIKLLNLRGATKKKAKAKNALEAPAGTKDGSDEDDATDDDTGDGNEEDIPDNNHLANVSTCTDTSLYEDQLPVPWYQQMEFTFDVELQSSFDRISQLTGALASDDWNVTYDKEPMEMKCPFDYLLRYIMFMIAVMARAADLGLVHN